MTFGRFLFICTYSQMSIVKSPLIILNMCCLSKETREQTHMLSWPRQLLLWAASFFGASCCKKTRDDRWMSQGHLIGAAWWEARLPPSPARTFFSSSLATWKHLCKQELWLQKSLGSLWAPWRASLALLKETLLHPQINNFQRLAKSLHKHLISPWPQCL